MFDILIFGILHKIRQNFIELVNISSNFKYVVILTYNIFSCKFLPSNLFGKFNLRTGRFLKLCTKKTVQKSKFFRRFHRLKSETSFSWQDINELFFQKQLKPIFFYGFMLFFKNLHYLVNGFLFRFRCVRRQRI